MQPPQGHHYYGVPPPSAPGQQPVRRFTYANPNLPHRGFYSPKSLAAGLPPHGAPPARQQTYPGPARPVIPPPIQGNFFYPSASVNGVVTQSPGRIASQGSPHPGTPSHHANHAGKPLPQPPVIPPRPYKGADFWAPRDARPAPAHDQQHDVRPTYPGPPASPPLEFDVQLKSPPVSSLCGQANTQMPRTAYKARPSQGNPTHDPGAPGPPPAPPPNCDPTRVYLAATPLLPDSAAAGPPADIHGLQWWVFVSADASLRSPVDMHTVGPHARTLVPEPRILAGVRLQACPAGVVRCCVALPYVAYGCAQAVKDFVSAWTKQARIANAWLSLQWACELVSAMRHLFARTYSQAKALVPMLPQTQRMAPEMLEQIWQLAMAYETGLLAPLALGANVKAVFEYPLDAQLTTRLRVALSRDGAVKLPPPPKG